MLSFQALIRALQDYYGEDCLRSVYRHPSVYLSCLSEEFADKPRELRELIVSEKISVDSSTIHETLYFASAFLDFLTPSEFESEYGSNPLERGHHYSQVLVQQLLNPSMSQEFIDDLELTDNPDNNLKIVHFYGYKGGQARSTVLVMLSKALADDGWKVLVVDFDTEAPSLDSLYGLKSDSIRSTLLGFRRSEIQIEPSRVFTSSGYVDAIFCRPISSEYDIEASVFPLRLSIDSLLTEQIAKDVEKVARDQEYDIVLCDHRSGISPTPLPWINTLKGPIVICTRLDHQWRLAASFFKILLQQNPENRGIFVSFKPDNQRDKFDEESQVNDLLDLIAEVKNASVPDLSENPDLAVSGEVLRDSWVMWPYDPVFSKNSQNGLTEIELSKPTEEALNQIRDCLDLPKRLHSNLLSREKSSAAALTTIGSNDEGLLIRTKNFRELLRPGNSTTYIFGKKGTGKTRLVKEMIHNGLGQPLLVDPYDSGELGLQASSLVIDEAKEYYKSFPKNFWNNLLIAGLETLIEDQKTSREKLAQKFQRRMEYPANSATSTILNNLIGQVSQLDLRRESRLFLIDSIEVVFNAKLIKDYTESLFEFVRSVMNEHKWSQVIKIKLFIREDLRRYSPENFEQQTYGNELKLQWGTQEIFNFLLSRIYRKEWYQEQFPNFIAKLDACSLDLAEGKISIEDCEKLILDIFPSKLKRSSIKMTTFLKTYFSDTASAYDSKSNYYPRVYDRFLDIIADPGENNEWRSYNFREKQIAQDGKIDSLLIFTAHEDAAVDYLSQVRDELYNILDLDDSAAVNKEKVTQLLNAFQGLDSPFDLEHRVSAISDITKFPIPKVREVMEQMKAWGIFEDVVRHPGQWRVGGLFKSGLRMVYRRKTSAGN